MNRWLLTFVIVTVSIFSFHVKLAQAKSRDVLSATKKAARKHKAVAARARWQQMVTFEAADFIEEIGGSKLLVGSVASGSRLGIPRHGPLYLFDKTNGKLLWKASRPSLPNGQYSLLATKPYIVLAGRERLLQLFAFDAQRGKQRWSIKLPKETVLSLSGSELFALSKSTRKISCFDLLSGKERWSLKTQVARLQKERPARMFLSAECVFVLGLGLQCFARAGGKIRWQVGHPSFANDTAALRFAGKICLWSKTHTMLIDEKRGQVLWHLEKTKAGVKALYQSGDYIFRVLKAKAPAQENFIQCVDRHKGQVKWLTKVADNVVSPTVERNGTLHFTGDRAIYGLDIENGKSKFFITLPNRFALNSPTAAPLLGTPDMLTIVGNKLWVWRDRAGVLAASLPLGKIAHEHYPILPVPDYNVNDATNLLFQVKNIVPKGLKKGGVIPLAEPGPNPFLIAAEKRHAEVMADKNADSLDVNISASSVMSQTKISSAFNQAQAAVNMGVSMIAAAQAFRQLNKARAQEGLKQRFAMQARAIMRRKQKAFQGNYFIEPFLARGIGMGLTVISLQSGKRRDFLYSPLVAPLLDFSVDLLTYTLDKRLERIYLVGAGMDERKYVPQKKWRWRLPRLSLIAYDLNSVPWLQKNRVAAFAPATSQPKALSQVEIQKIVAAALKAQGIDPTQAANKANKANKADKAGQTAKASIGQKSPGSTLAAALQQKNYELAFDLIKRGADVNKPGSFNLAPIHFASMQLHTGLMKELIKKGANVNAKNSQGLTPLVMLINNGYWFIHKEKMLPVVELLLQSGAQTSYKTNLNIPLKEHAKKQSRKLGKLFDRYGGKR